MSLLESDLRQKLFGKVVIVGIGNVLKGDDAVGPLLASRLNNRIRAIVIDAGTVPENFLHPIINAKPDSVVLFDSVVFDAVPGTIKIFPPGDLPVSHFSTHGMSLSLFIEQLISHGIANVLLVGIQPEQIRLGSKLSPAMKKALTELENILLSILG
ncbi:MAG: hydrogenase 3 maturation endopeptidase HyCI [Spirochaetota bacterium]